MHSGLSWPGPEVLKEWPLAQGQLAFRIGGFGPLCCSLVWPGSTPSVMYSQALLNLGLQASNEGRSHALKAVSCKLQVTY